MYFHRKKTPSGETLQLLASYRPKGGRSPTHEVVASLGDAAVPDAWLKPASRLIQERLAGQPSLAGWGLPPAALEWVDRVVLQIERQGGWPRGDRPTGRSGGEMDDEVVDGVLIGRVEHSHSTVLGPLLCALHAWEKLGLDGLLGELGFNPAQRQAAAALVTSRLAEPLSEHALMQWLPHSSLPDLLGEEVLRGGTDRYYRVGDGLLSHRDRIERHLRERTEGHFGLQRTIFLYDLTNFHFEGVCAGNPKARRGVNKQKRNDCPQVVVGMVFDEFGFEVLHRTFPGNTNDGRTLPEMAACLREAASSQCLSSTVQPTVVLDGGLAARKNLEELRQQGFHYLVNDRRTGRGRWREQFAADGFTPIPGRAEDQQVEVRRLQLPDESDGGLSEQVLLCRSAGRRNKELAIRSHAEVRLRDDLQKLCSRVGKGRLKDQGAVQRAVGRLLERHPRAARFYQVTADADSSGTPVVRWQRHDERCQAEDEMAGCYVLRTDRSDLGPEQLWGLYMTLCRAEDGFQALKSDLGLRPNYHQLEQRVDAHVFVTVLAYQLLRFLLYTLEQAGDRRSWFTLRTVLSTHCYATVTLPTRDGKLYRLRKPGVPEACQWDIYRKLGISSLRRLPRTKTVSTACHESDRVEGKM